MSATFQVAEHHLQEAVQWLKLGVEAIGALLVGVGVVVALIQLIRLFLTGRKGAYTSVRLILARYLVLALEFQVGADILSTAVSPTWNQIGQLGAIVVIRTALNYFLSIEMREELRQGDEKLERGRT